LIAIFVCSSIHFFTSGGGSKAFKGLREYGEVEGVRFVFDGQGFLAVSMREDSVVLSFYDVFGNVPYSYTLQR
jgi:tartrate-resistant acid phosphatase type 5